MLVISGDLGLEITLSMLVLSGLARGNEARIAGRYNALGLLRQGIIWGCVFLYSFDEQRRRNVCAGMAKLYESN